MIYSRISQLSGLIQCSQYITGFYRITYRYIDAGNGSVFRSNYRDLHLHSLQNNNRIAGLYGLSDTRLHLEYFARNRSAHFNRARIPCRSRSRSCSRRRRSRRCRSRFRCCRTYRCASCAALFYSYIIYSAIYGNRIIFHLSYSS